MYMHTDAELVGLLHLNVHLERVIWEFDSRLRFIISS